MLKKENELRIGADIDDCLLGFMSSYIQRFGTPKEDYIITKNVYKLRRDKQFWENLPKLRDMDFIPELYCTKRINPKSYTINSLKKNNFPIRPIYQMYYQKGNKAKMIKGKVDVFIDDSYSNVKMMNDSGVPCLLMDAPHNQGIDFNGRIYTLTYKEIYDTLFKMLEDI